MILPSKNDTIHYAWLCRVLTEIADDSFLTSVLRFKGGTCSAMRNIVERFSVDLDFDLIAAENNVEVRGNLKKIFDRLGLLIEDQSRKIPQFFLKYKNESGKRNTLRVDMTYPVPRSNEYEAVRFADIDRILYCQTAETMFSNKLVAVLDRYEKHHSLAGRDFFDIHTFFLKNTGYRKEVIEERRNTDTATFMSSLADFIREHVNQRIIDEDLNHLLPVDSYRKVRKFLLQEVLMFVENEAQRLA